MAESARACAECGRPVEAFSGVTINDAPFHNPCWDHGRRLVPQARPEQRSAGIVGVPRADRDSQNDGSAM